MITASNTPAPAGGTEPVTRAELTDALQQQKKMGQIKSLAAGMIGGALSRCIGGGNQQGQSGGSVDVKISLGESPMPHEPKDEITLDVKPGGSGGDGGVGVQLSHGEDESGQDFGL
jgi:hypothetical protein